MININNLQEALNEYKSIFPERWKNEKFKWEAVKCFQDNWDIAASDFPAMLDKAFAKTDSLLTSRNRFPLGMLQLFSKEEPETVKNMFTNLYDESKDVFERMEAFKNSSEELKNKYGKDQDASYQNENSISTYLWLRYPDKHYMYKYTEVRDIASKLESDYTFRKGAYEENINNFYKLYDEIHDYIIKDSELVELLKDNLDSECYEDNNFITLTIDFAFYISRKFKEEAKVSTEKESGLADQDVHTTHYWLYAPGDNATEWDEFYNQGIMAIGWDAIGDLRQYSSKDAMKTKMKEVIDSSKSFKNSAYATWQFANEMKVGDVVFAKKGRFLIIGRGVVESDYIYDEKRQKHKNIRKVRWTDKGEWDNKELFAMKTLTDVTAYTDFVEKVNNLIDPNSEEEVDTPEVTYPKYTEEDFLNEVYMSETEYNTLVNLLKKKKNVILQGAPGVGKTFTAKRLAYSMMGEKNQDRVMMVQFHQSYSYEDFIEGFRPASEGNGFEIKKGSFYKFCKKAEEDKENEYFFIIDEINRGNLSKIFGELFMLIENDKRGNSLQLLYSDEKFNVPQNVYLIGMMNTADRSLAILDYALRRRFAFFDMKPGFDTDGFIAYEEEINSDKFNSLVNMVKALNMNISNDDSLGEGFCIGHSYFCDYSSDNDLSDIVEYELIPLIKEYWFDEPEKVRDWSNKLRGSIK